MYINKYYHYLLLKVAILGRSGDIAGSRSIYLRGLFIKMLFSTFVIL